MEELKLDLSEFAGRPLTRDTIALIEQKVKAHLATAMDGHPPPFQVLMKDRVIAVINADQAQEYLKLGWKTCSGWFT